MNTQKLKMWEGISSPVWATIGFVLFFYWRDHFGFHSIIPQFLGVFVLWWGVSLLLAICGLRSHSKIGMVAGAVTILGFIDFAWAAFFHG